MRILTDKELARLRWIASFVNVPIDPEAISKADYIIDHDTVISFGCLCLGCVTEIKIYALFIKLNLITRINCGKWFTHKITKHGLKEIELQLMVREGIKGLNIK